MKPRLLDLFCGAGGAAMGYSRAGFEVVGVDNRPMPRYPFEFIQADALEFMDAGGWRGFDAIHASPPCQAYVTLANRWRGKSTRADGHPRLIEPTRNRLVATGLPWVIENIVPAPVKGAILCGSMFDLGVRRHRKFEANFWFLSPRCAHALHPDIAGVYGDHPDGGRLWTRISGGGVHRRAVNLTDGRTRMGIDWMDWRELCESIPPAYTEYIGGWLIKALAATS